MTNHKFIYGRWAWNTPHILLRSIQSVHCTHEIKKLIYDHMIMQQEKFHPGQTSQCLCHTKYSYAMYGSTAKTLYSTRRWRRCHSPRDADKIAFDTTGIMFINWLTSIKWVCCISLAGIDWDWRAYATW